MSQISFNVSARTAKLIGQENFSNVDGAIIELVKNTYDADAKNCIIVFDIRTDISIDNEGNESKKINKEYSSIYIMDNGSGMTNKVISEQWMTIGTDDKLYKFKSDGGRIKTGAKGIGRFALNRLGTMTELYTVSKEIKSGCFWKVNWKDFDKKGAVVSDVKAELFNQPNLDLTNKIQRKFYNVKGIQNIIKEHPFNYGTLIKTSNLNDDWDDNTLSKLFENLEFLLPPKEQPDFNIHLFSVNNSSEYGKVKSAFYDDFDYKIEAKYLDDLNKTLTIDITRNELDIALLENRYKEIFDYDVMRRSPYRLKDIKSKKITINTDLTSLKGFSTNVDKKLLGKIGKFDFTFYFIKNIISDDKNDGDTRKYPYLSFNSANRRAWLKKFGGIKIFRDDFRVRPYGENGNDWLKLGERQSQSPGGAGQKMGGYRIRPNQISGTINISRIYNESFQDKSGREGIIENDIFDLFKNILLEIIACFEKDRNVIMHHLFLLDKKRNEDAEAKRKAQEEAGRINKEREEREARKGTDEEQNAKNENKSIDTKESLAKGVKILSNEIEEKEEEIRLLRNFASVGLIISSFAHEIKSLRSRLMPRTTFLLRELKNHINENDFRKIDKDDNPFYMIKLIQEEDIKLKHWLEYSLNSLKRDKRERKNLNFGDYFVRFKATWQKAIEQRNNITIKLSGTKNDENAIRAFEIDMDSIFNNLLTNSLSALKGKRLEKKVIKINWKKNNDNIEIIFSDNGRGLEKEYHKSPSDIFNLLESSRKDKKGNKIGTGLGLYIVKSIIDEYNDASISILKLSDGFSLKIIFPTRKER